MSRAEPLSSVEPEPPGMPTTAVAEWEPPPRRRAFPPSYATRALLLLNLVVFALPYVVGSLPLSDMLIPSGASLDLSRHMGAIVGLEAALSEPWRVLAHAFLHSQLIHVLANLFALFTLGRLLEPLVGGVRFLAIYCASALVSGAAAAQWEAGVVVGASGAIFGIGWAAAVTLVLRRNELNKGAALVSAAIVAAMLSLALGVGFLDWESISGGFMRMSNVSHVAGSISGFVLAFFPRLRWPPPIIRATKVSLWLLVATGASLPALALLFQPAPPWIQSRAVELDDLQLEIDLPVGWVTRTGGTSASGQPVLLRWEHEFTSGRRLDVYLFGGRSSPGADRVIEQHRLEFESYGPRCTRLESADLLNEGPGGYLLAARILFDDRHDESLQGWSGWLHNETEDRRALCLAIRCIDTRDGPLVLALQSFGREPQLDEAIRILRSLRVR